MLFGLSLLQLLLLAYAGGVVLLMGASFVLLRGFPRLPPAPPDADLPLVSVILPVRNQVTTVGRCVTSLLASDYPEFELIAVEGGSADGTREALAAFGSTIQVVDEPPLPEGWVGKNWACHQGAQAAQGELLLFTDGDTVHEPDLLRKAVAYHRAEGLDLLTLHSRLRLESFWEHLLQPLMIFIIGLVTRGTWINRPDKPWAVANGQYLLFRRDAYEALGGHPAVAERVDEDYRLAQLMKRRGDRVRMLDGTQDLEVRMYTSLTEIWNGWGKGIFPGMDFSLSRLLRGMVSLLLLFVLPFGLLGGALYTWATLGAEVGLLLWVSGILSLLIWIRLGVAYGFLGSRPAYALLTPLGAMVIGGITLHSAWRYRRRGGVAWKGRIYGIPRQP